MLRRPAWRNGIFRNQMATTDRSAAKYRPLIRGGLLALALAAVIALLAAIAVSNVPMRGAEMFGAIANKIKGNPGATTVIFLSAGAALWLAVGLLTAGQEWLAGRRKAP